MKENDVNINSGHARLAFASSVELPTIPPFYALAYIMKL